MEKLKFKVDTSSDDDDDNDKSVFVVNRSNYAHV